MIGLESLTLNLAGVDMGCLAPTLRGLTRLEKLDLASSHVTAAALSPALQHLKGLTRLAIDNNPEMGADGAAALAPALGSTVKDRYFWDTLPVTS